MIIITEYKLYDMFARGISEHFLKLYCIKMFFQFNKNPSLIDGQAWTAWQMQVGKAERAASTQSPAEKQALARLKAKDCFATLRRGHRVYCAAGQHARQTDRPESALHHTMLNISQYDMDFKFESLVNAMIWAYGFKPDSTHH